MITSNTSKDLQNYLQFIETKSIDSLKEGYFHVDHVIDAFQKGEEMGSQKTLEKLKDKFVRTTTQMFLYGLDLIHLLEEKGYKTVDFYVNPYTYKFIVVTELENTFNEGYINTFFTIAYDKQKRFKDDFGTEAHYLFVENEGLNTEELKADGFINI
ncbi:hypothetical protein [Myroides profundi]|uniref:Uncharacterized protein n=1 Tax=Myroides profundi TaxID=480520 RepID=A0AAJ4W2N1_MYRPR|nr:hypothetical protein [Myroides profundi]AJH16406.1 hypothetical protein MPR_3286 [Myroides profundi]SEQ56284.1 hypothetical protein SAMN04488089_10469 [Myroides profundi]